MKQRILTTMLIAAMATAGCSKSDNPETSTPDSYVPSTTPIGFSTEYNWGDDEETTRGVIKDGDFESGDTFGVFAYYNAGGTLSSSEPNFMNNQLVSYDGTNWSYSPIKYWSNNTSDTFDFYAYSPHISGEDSDAVSMSIISGTPTITYTPNTDVTKQVDFMTGQPNNITNANMSSGVSFNFEHKLTQIRFSAAHTCESSDVEIKILAITLYANPNASGTFSTEDGSFSWNNYTEQETTEDFTISQSNSQLISSAISQLTDNNGEYTDLMLDAGTDGVMLIPAKLIGDNPKLDITFSYQGQYTSTMTLTESITFDNKDGLPVGASARFVFTIEVDEDAVVSISANDILVEAWEEVELGTSTI